MAGTLNGIAFNRTIVELKLGYEVKQGTKKVL